MKFKISIFLVVLALIGIYFLIQPKKQTENISTVADYPQQIETSPSKIDEVIPPPDPNEHFYIESLKKRDYPSSDIKIEETLKPGINYQRYIASYQSDGLKINGLFTVPNDNESENSFPAIVFLHGYLDPKTYKTTDRYVAYQDGFARNGFITFKPDLRGHGLSEGSPVNSNFSQEYVIDTLNLISALKDYTDVNPNLIGMWGHSNGGGLTLRAMEVSADIKAAVIWAGVVGSYEDLLITYRNKIPWLNDKKELLEDLKLESDSSEELIAKNGQPNPDSLFWSKFDPYSYIKNISTPIQLHHGTDDERVPVELSRHFEDVLVEEGKKVELYEYEGGDHNLASPNFSIAMERSILFFKQYLTE